MTAEPSTEPSTGLGTEPAAGTSEGGSAGMSVQDYRALLASVFDDEVGEWVAQAEATGRFPRLLIRRLGEAGVFARKWEQDSLPHLAKLNELSYALGRTGSVSIGVGVSLHDSAIAVLRRFGRGATAAAVADRAVRGQSVLCLAASESSGGSDLQIVQTEVRAEGEGFRIRGRKKFVSLSPLAEYILVVARDVTDDPGRNHGNVVLMLVPTAQVEVMKPYTTVSAGALETAAVEIDTVVPADHLLARAGIGLAAASWGLAHERYAVAGQIAANCDRVLGITLARMHERTQFGHTLIEHQALRLRMADLQARVDLLRHALTGIAAGGRLDLRTAAAAKVSAARLGEEVFGECMHIFGGSGFLTEETPVANWWRDMKLARVGGGTDEVLWELVAAGMKPDVAGYRSFAATIS